MLLKRSGGCYQEPRDAVEDAVCDQCIKGLFYPVQVRLLVNNSVYEAEGPDDMLLLGREHFTLRVCLACDTSWHVQASVDKMGSCQQELLINAK